MPTVDVVIVNWNTGAAALGAATAFATSKGINASVTIFDNDSRPEERAALSDGGGARVLPAERNLGYGAAANLALRSGDGELVCVSNADARPHVDALLWLCEGALTDPRAGMVGPVFDGGTHHYHSALPGRAALLVRPLIGSFGKHSPRPPAARETIEVQQVSGACFVMKRTTWEEIGGFDEGFFLWYDDVDLARRLHLAGYRNLVVGGARVEHDGASSFSQIEPRTAQAIRLASLERYIGKHHAGLAPIARPLLRVAALLRARGADVPGNDG